VIFTRPARAPRSWLAANMYKGFTFHLQSSREPPAKSA
jgi:hypothetical protein